MLNGIQTGPPILIMISILIFVGTLSLTTLVASPNPDFSLVSTLLLLQVDCFAGIVIFFGGMSMVYQKSSILVRTMQWKQSSAGVFVRDRKWEHKFYRSCSALKIRISSSNFVDELTPLNFLQFSISSAANLLLLN